MGNVLNRRQFLSTRLQKNLQMTGPRPLAQWFGLMEEAERGDGWLAWCELSTSKAPCYYHGLLVFQAN